MLVSDPDKPGSSPLAGNVQSHAALSRQLKIRLLGLCIFAVLLCIAFRGALIDVIHLVAHKERYSYVPLVPIICGYLIWIRRKQIRPEFTTSIKFASIPTLVAIIALVCSGLPADPIDRLSIHILAFLSLLLGGSFLFLGATMLRQITFPLTFLAFAIPMPATFAEGIDVFLQYTSAEAAYWMLTIARVPILRNGLEFNMPNISIRVAPECSGYNSTFALFMVSILAGHLFLNAPRKRIALTLAVIPLAILRNGFRITTISLLCVYVDPSMIDSYIHHHGGPFFFALSLIPFFVLLWWLRKTDIAKSPKDSPNKA